MTCLVFTGLVNDQVSAVLDVFTGIVNDQVSAVLDIFTGLVNEQVSSVSVHLLFFMVGGRVSHSSV